VTAPASYVAPWVTPVTETLGGVLDGGGAETFTVNVAGAKSKVPPLLLETWDTVIVVEPVPSARTVTVLVSLQLVNVAGFCALVRDAVATAGSLEFTPMTRVVLPVRLQPLFPSLGFGPLPLATTLSVVLPSGPPTVSGMVSATASSVASTLLAMSSATAIPAKANVATIASPAAAHARPAHVLLRFMSPRFRLHGRPPRTGSCAQFW
jgi:hypothetical protein